MDTPQRANLAGRQLGAYRLVTELGAGGMGTVYYAEHAVIGRRAAVKVLDPAMARDAGVVSRFFAEARSVNAIRHPNIVDVVDLGQDGETYFLVMELLEGETLGARLERVRRIEPEALASILRECASALNAAHQRGMVHRDLKPENIFLATAHGGAEVVKLLDFGIVKLRGESKDDLVHTQQGMLLGTPTYMSPEQCQARTDLDARSDIYSLGVVLYEALTGRRPFERNSVLALLAAHQVDIPEPPHEVERSVPRHVSDVVMRALAKERERRPASARALSELFDIALSVRTSRATVSARMVRHEDPEVRRRQAAGVGARLSEIVARRISEGSLNIPAMPQACLDALELLRAEDVRFDRVASAIAKDPLLAARALSVASSSALGARGPIADLSSALVRIGIDGVRALLVEQAARAVFVSRDPRLRARIRSIWESSVALGRVAAELSRVAQTSATRGTAQMAGLLRGVGHPILAALLVAVERSVVIEGAQTSWLCEEVFDAIVAEHGMQVGVEVSRKWELPDAVASSIGCAAQWDREDPSALSNLIRLGELPVSGQDAAEIEVGCGLLEIPLESLAEVRQAAFAELDAPPAPARSDARTTQVGSRMRRAAG